MSRPPSSAAVTVELNGRTYRGNYRIEHGTLRVFLGLGLRTAPLRAHEAVDLAASRMLLDLVRHGGGGGGSYDYSLG